MNGFITGREVATEVFTSGWCNLQCEYCYIPKTKLMKDIHKEILYSFHTDYWINVLRELYDDKLEYLSLWGTEPLLTINSYKKVIEKAQEIFPKLKVISFSTNMIFVDSLIKFLENLELKKQLTIDVQISIDGPEYITDKNRNKGTTKQILNNIDKFLKWYDEKGKYIKNLKIKTKLKQTLTKENINYMIDNNLIEDVAVFMLRLSDKLKNHIEHLSSYQITIAVPENYTQEDGIKFSNYRKKLREIGSKYNVCFDTYKNRFLRLFNYYEDFLKNPAMFTCSGGDSQFGVGYMNDLHICHRTLFLNNEKYVKSIETLPPEKNHDIENQERGTVDLIKKWYIADINDEYEIKRFRYILGNYHYFVYMKIIGLLTNILELADVGQISKIYKDEEIALVFAMFLSSGLGCHMENLLNTGSLYTFKNSIIKMFGNGYFEQILKEVLDERL